MNYLFKLNGSYSEAVYIGYQNIAFIIGYYIFYYRIYYWGCKDYYY